MVALFKSIVGLLSITLISAVVLNEILLIQQVVPTLVALKLAVYWVALIFSRI